MDDERPLEEDELEVVTIVDETGREHDFELFTMLEVADKHYAVLYPLDEDEEEEGEAIILRLEKDEDGDDTLVDIEDEDEWAKVVAAWEALVDS